MMSQTEFDVRLRLAAVEHVRRLSAGGVLTSDDLRAGFSFEGVRIPLINPQRGILKPTGLRSLLSVRTVYPTTGRKVWYDDQRLVHAQIQRGDELVDYAFMGRDAEAADNRWLREAAEEQVPILYFLGVAPQRYTAIWPTYVADWLPGELKVRLAFGAPAEIQSSSAVTTPTAIGLHSGLSDSYPRPSPPCRLRPPVAGNGTGRALL